jgi:hypothetical protein
VGRIAALARQSAESKGMKGVCEMKKQKSVYYYKIEGSFIFLKPVPDFSSEDDLIGGIDGDWAVWFGRERMVVVSDINFKYRNNPALLEANIRKGFKTDQVISDPTLITPAQTPEFFERWNRITANPQPTENQEKPKKTLKGVLIGIVVAIFIAVAVIEVAIAILGW